MLVRSWIQKRHLAVISQQKAASGAFARQRQDSTLTRVGPFHDRVQTHTDKVSNHNDKLISYTDKGLGHASRDMRENHHFGGLGSENGKMVMICPALLLLLLLLLLLMSCRGEVFMPCRGEVLVPCRGENFNALSW